MKEDNDSQLSLDSPDCGVSPASRLVGRNRIQPIRVFVSSKCDGDGPFYRLRADLAQELNSFGFFAAYIWELGGASTALAEENYRMELRDSDVCVFIVDESVDVPQGVRKEIDQARSLKKKQLYYFCDEYSQGCSGLRRELSGPDAPTYKVVHRFADLKNQVVADLLTDVLRVYRGWCNDAVVFNDDASPVQANPAPGNSTSLMRKECYSSLLGTRAVLCNLLFGPNEETTPSGVLDEACIELAKALYFEFTIGRFNPAKMISAAGKLLPKPYAEVSARRWEGICRYCRGDIDGSIEALNYALAQARESCLDDWYIADILIDLRNIYHGTKGVFESKYQDELAARPTSVVYPLIDRAEAFMYAKINNDKIATRVKPIHSFTFGENRARFLDEVTEVFAIAACYGSWTQLSQMPSLMKSVAFHLCRKYDDAMLKASLLKLTIVVGRRGDGERTIQTFPDNCFDDDSPAAKDLFDFCAGYKGLSSSGTAVFEAFGMIGCYLGEADFARAQATVIHEADLALLSHDRWESLPRSIFESLVPNIDRLSVDWVLDYCIRSLSSGEQFWVEQVLRFLSRARVNYASVSASTIDRLAASIKSLVSGNEGPDCASQICSALIGISRCDEGVFGRRLYEAAELLPEGERERFDGLRQNGDDGSLSKLALRQVELLEKANQAQGVGGAFSFGDDHALLFSGYVARLTSPDGALLERGFAALVDCLAGRTQDYGSKLSALRAIAALLESLSLDEVGDNGMLAKTLKDRASLLSGIQLGDASSFLIELGADILLLGIADGDGRNLMCSLAKCYGCGQYEQAHVADLLKMPCSEMRIRTVPESALGAIFSFAAYLIESDFFQLSYRGLELMSLFLRHDEYRAAAAGILFSAYRGQSPRGKVTIIDSIPVVREFDEALAKAMRNMVLRDNAVNVRAYLLEQENGHVS